MKGSIICGIDDSLSAREAARVARALGSRLGRGLIFVRVVESDAPDDEVSAIAERLEVLSAEATEVDCGAAWLVDEGDPANRLVEAAREAEASLIVVGSTGHRSPLLGSVSAEVSRRAPCPVVVVPPGAEAHFNGYDDGERPPQVEDGHSAGGIVRFGLGSRGADLVGS